ncbi:MAG: hypothetical protein CVU89_12550 [Firmicutes bacterium HGW-Firmicutes-14]|nr:MAG: hypothetical protein CVU89_12550 [Firmicutes bacterium HGW-Firmicutes-14]
MTEFIRTGIPAGILALGLVTGVAFGFVIFKSGASRYENILKMLLLKDFTILKFMMTAVMVASVGIFLFDSVIYIAPVQLVRLVAGGLIFGVGFALAGYCPGTVMVALGEGKRDAVYGVMGGILAAAVFAHLYPVLEKPLINPLNYGALTIGSLLGSNLIGLIVLLVVFGGATVVLQKIK